MDFYNKHFQQLICQLDPYGMLNVPFNVATNVACVRKYFKTDIDFQKLDVPWMCNQLIKLLNDHKNTIAISSSFLFLENDYQRLRQNYLCEQLEFNQVVNGYPENVNNEIIAIFDPSFQLPPNANDVPNLSNNEVNNSNSRMLDAHQRQSIIQQIEEVPIPGQYLLFENLPLPSNSLGNFLNEEILQSDNAELLLRSIEQPRYSLNVLHNHQNQAEKLIGQSDTSNPQDQLNQVQHLTEKAQEKDRVSLENDISQSLLLKQPVKRKNSVINKIYKKRPVERSTNVCKTRMRKLEGELLDRPLEQFFNKYFVKSDHLPLRYHVYGKQLNVLKSTVTNELEQNKDQKEDELNNTINMMDYEAINENFNYGSLNNPIYQQTVNNLLPHLSQVPNTEEGLGDNSLEWRNTVNEINRKLGDTLKDTSRVSKIYQESLKHRIHQSLVNQRTLIDPEVPLVDAPINVAFPALNQTEELFNNKSCEPQNVLLNANTEINGQMPVRTPTAIDNNEARKLLIPDKSPGQLNVVNINDVNNQLVPTEVLDFQNNVEPLRVNEIQKIDVIQKVTDILIQSPEATLLKFTDLCPLHVTNRKRATSMMNKLLLLHKEKVMKLSQPSNTWEPSSVSIELIGLNS